MLRKPLTRVAPSVNFRTSSALPSSDSYSSAWLLPDRWNSAIGVTYPTLTVPSERGMNQNQPFGRLSVMMSPARFPSYRLQPWK